MIRNKRTQKIKKAVLALLAACTLTGAALQPAFAAYENVLDGRFFDNQYLVIKSDPSGKVGKSMNVPVVIKAPHDMEDVWVGLSPDIDSFYQMAGTNEETPGTINTFPFEINEATFQPKRLGNIKEGASKSITLTAKVRKDMKEGYYTIPIAVYQGGKDGAMEPEFMNVWIGLPTSSEKETTEEATEEIAFALGEGQSTPYGVYPNVMNYAIKLRNKSKMNAYDVTVSMVLNKSSEDFPFLINDANYDRHYDVIEAGQTVEVPYSMAIREDSYSGFYPIKYKITYRESIDGKQKVAEGPAAYAAAGQSETQSTDTSVKNKDYEVYVHIKSKEKEKDDKKGEFNENDRTKARIIVENFRTVPEKVMAGEEFELYITMKNASADVSASNILLTLESEKVDNAAVFSTESGSASFVINSLGSGESTEVAARYLPKASADQRSYSITITEKFDSPEFKNAEEKVTIDIPVFQKSRLSTSTLEVVPEVIEEGSETNVMFGINNTGRVQLYNVNVKFLADSVKTTEAYVGNIKPGDTGNVDVMITGTAPTMDGGKVKILISYEDENGEVTEVEKEMMLTVTEPMPMDESMWEEFPEGEEVNAPSGIKGLFTDPKKRKTTIALCAVLAAAVIGAAVILLRRRKKKKQQEEEGIDDEIS